MLSSPSIFQLWASFQCNIWKSHSERLLENKCPQDTFPVIWVLSQWPAFTQVVTDYRRLVCAGRFLLFFFQCEFLSGNFALVFSFSTLFSQQLQDRGCYLSYLNKKAKPLCLASRTNTHSCWEGSPMWPCTSGLASSHLLSYYRAVCPHAKTSSGLRQWLLFKKAIFMSVLTTLTQLLV